ncbi:helix-turn-helix domain-containing protein [Curtobacterium sp. YC1]|uniref:helix-turn-helix domain-containing protein n=1 Tax=Curtobacterium sp. YC1 TaxID=2795488 RepID=UPI0018E58CF2|nr:helix-turn-helix domain-containing protein [Curtobacterium sp. YC1]QQD75092.1 helix-turn-helix domain-containing protein [Curtobacterium sp. YC1]
MALHSLTYYSTGVVHISTDLDTAQGQQDMEDILSTELDHQRKLNLRLRQQGEKTKQFPRPAYGWKTKKMDTYLFRVGKYLNSVALRMLNDNVEYVLDQDRTPLRGRLLSKDQLSEALYYFVHHKAAQHIVYDQYDHVESAHRAHALIQSALAHECDDVAAWALDQWDKDARAIARRRGAAGGMKSKRGATYRLEALLALPEGMTKAQQAETLGCSLGTVDNLRRKARTATASLPDDSYARVRATLVDDIATSKEFDVVPAFRDQLSGEVLGRDAVRDDDLTRRLNGRVEEQDGIHDLKVAQGTDTDQPDVFDRFYANFHAWQKDWERRAHGEVDITDELEALLDERLPG